MRFTDSLLFSGRALAGYRTRTLLMIIAISIGSASVVFLTALGEGGRLYVTGQFSSLGTNLLIVLPGRSETTGALPPLLGETPRDLTVGDALALYRSHAVQSVAPIVVGTATISHREREREITVLGTTPEFYSVRELQLAQGTFLPGNSSGHSAAVCVLGNKLSEELFGNQSALGKSIRINDRRYRITGVLKSKGESMGMNMSELALIPVLSAQALFNTESLFRIIIQIKARNLIAAAKLEITNIIRDRHDNEDDITVISQDAILKTFDKIFRTLSKAVGGIAAISLGVAGILIMNIMLIAVSQRSGEIGLLKALGAPANLIQKLFLFEALVLTVCGVIIGFVIAFTAVFLFSKLFPAFPIQVPIWAPVLAATVAVLSGLIFSLMPARKAARLDPVQSLSRR